MTNTACERNSPKVPRVVSWGPTLLELADRDITFPCTAVGSPAPEIYWINNKNQIIDSDTISSHYKVSEYDNLLVNMLKSSNLIIFSNLNGCKYYLIQLSLTNSNSRGPARKFKSATFSN